MQDDRSPLVREALKWFALTRDDEVSDADRIGLENWRQLSAEHEAAWQRAWRLWSGLAPVETEIRQTRRKAITRRRVLSSALGLVIAFSAGGYWALRSSAWAEYRTGPGERRNLDLADGSRVELNSSSAISTTFTETERRITVHHGEAFFTVGSDPARPFVVAAGQGTVRALGTQFNVNMLDDAVTVVVVEHSVQLSLRDGQSEKVSEGQQGGYGDSGFLSQGPADLFATEAWRTGRLIYHDVPLRRVLRDFERHLGGVIVLSDDDLGLISITAAVDISEVGQALDAMATSLPMSVMRIGSLVVVSRRGN